MANIKPNRHSSCLCGTKLYAYTNENKILFRPQKYNIAVNYPKYRNNILKKKNDSSRIVNTMIGYD